MNLSDYPKVRRALYFVQFAVAGVLFLIGVWCAAAQTGLPHWYAPVTAVTSALWTYLGLTAGTNVKIPPDVPQPPVQPEVDPALDVPPADPELP